MTERENQLSREIENIRQNYNVIRELIAESNADLSQQIRLANEHTVASVKADNEKTEENVKEQIKSAFGFFQWAIGIFVVLVLGFGGWLSLDHLKLKEEHKSLSSDFGMVLKITSKDHENCIGFLDLVDKYFPARGKQERKP